MGEEFDLGAVADMPLTVDGSADYNVSNIAGAALARAADSASRPTPSQPCWPDLAPIPRTIPGD